MLKQRGPLTVGNKEFQEFNRSIGPKVQRALELDSGQYLSCDKYELLPGQRGMVYGLRDPRQDLRVPNKRRGQNFAFPFVRRKETAVLLSISFEWVRVSSRVRFVGAQFVVYLLTGTTSRTSDPLSAQQIMRLEWQGRADNGSFEAAYAGHPHWQVDAVPAERGTGFAPTAVVSMDQLVVREDRSAVSWLSRVHLASAAGGWAKGEGWSGEQHECDTHANSPDSLDELAAWTTSASRYLSQQINSALP